MKDHVTPLLKQLHLLPLSQCRISKILLMVCKTLQGDGPTYLKEMLDPYSCDLLIRITIILDREVLSVNICCCS